MLRCHASSRLCGLFSFCKLLTADRSPLTLLLSQHPREDQRNHNRGVAFDDELWRLGAELAPCDFLVGDRAGITAVAGGGIADLRKITPQRHTRAAEILVQHRHDADRK